MVDCLTLYIREKGGGRDMDRGKEGKRKMKNLQKSHPPPPRYTHFETGIYVA